MDTGREEERVRCIFTEMHRDRNTDTYITISKIDGQWEFAVCYRELKQRLCINLEGWDWEGDGREGREEGDICTPMADSC